MAEVEYGLGLAPVAPVPDLVELAVEAEHLGYRWIWVNDERLERDPFTVLAAIAGATERVKLGPGVTNPYSRHPALLATATATLDELSGQRAVLGLGAGGTNHRALAIERRAPARALEESITLIRGLWNGATISIDGVVGAEDARLDFAPSRRGIPIHLGARGPRLLELAGAAADGVIVGNVTTAEGWEYALGRIAAGAERAGRSPDGIALTAWMYASVADDEEAALDAVRPMAATSLVTSRGVLDELGLTMPREFERVMSRHDWSLASEHVREGGALLPPELVRSFGLAGDPQACRQQLADLLGRFPRISQVAIVPLASDADGVIETVRRFIAEVVPGSVGARW